MEIAVRGLVLREVNYKDRDKILTILVEGRGKITVKARGCRGRGSRLAAAAQSLVWAELTLFQYRDRWTLREANTLDDFRNLRKDLNRLALASYFAEAAEALSEEEVNAPGLLQLILNCLYALDRLDYPPEQVKAAFELRLACMSGYAPQLACCPSCGRAEPEYPMLGLTSGTVHCRRCREAGEVSVPLDGAALAALRHMVSCPPKKLLSFRIPGPSLTLLSRACERFLLAQLDHGFRTLDFYYSLIKVPAVQKTGTGPVC